MSPCTAARMACTARCQKCGSLWDVQVCADTVDELTACKPLPQITTWEEAWPLLNLGGVYICEDMATSMVCRRPACSSNQE